MSPTMQGVKEIAITAFGIAGIIFFFWVWLSRSKDRGALVVRWVLSAMVLGLLWRFVTKMMRIGGQAKAFAVVGSALGGMAMAVLWVPAIVDGIGRRFSGLYDGGDLEVEPKPFYSVFTTLRKRGKYQEALAEVRRQLDQFPKDFEGQLLLAELQAENLNDLPGAELTVRRFCAQPGHAPLNIAYALNRLADWHLSLSKDRDAAQRELEKIIELLPDSEMSVQAAQRIGRLADTETLLSPENRRAVTMKAGVQNIGLLANSAALKPEEEDPAQIVAGYVKHLEEHPQDGHIREQLAILYANYYQRMDLATDQLEQLIQQPNQPAKNVIKWLNLLADLQVAHEVDPELIHLSLLRIIKTYPNLAAAENARRRLDVLNVEINARKNKGQAVKLGSYEQNLGLKKKT